MLDYIWGPSAQLLLKAAAGRGDPDGEPRIRYVQIGAISGSEIALSAEWLRSSGLEIEAHPEEETWFCRPVQVMKEGKTILEHELAGTL